VDAWNASRTASIAKCVTCVADATSNRIIREFIMAHPTYVDSCRTANLFCTFAHLFCGSTHELPVYNVRLVPSTCLTSRNILVNGPSYP
jgi:hypothetical protein